jgi:hypothetical protein
MPCILSKFSNPFFHLQKAVDYAYKVFGKEIAGVSRDRIIFVVCAIVAGEHRTVHISPQAWPAVIPTLAKFEIIDVCITPEIQVSDVPPAYPRLATVAEVPEPVGCLKRILQGAEHAPSRP